MSRLIRIDAIDRSPWADLFPHDEEHVARLAEDIAERGIQTPLHVYPRGDRYELLSGHDRLEAAKRAGLTEVPCDTRSMLADEDERFAYFLKDNTLRKDVDKRALVRVVLLKHADWSDRRVAALCAVSPTTAGAVRSEMEAEGLVSTVDTRTGRDGVAQPARKPAQTGSIVGRKNHTNGNGAHAPATEDGAMAVVTKTRPGPRLKIADGETPEQVVRRAMGEHESVDDAARAVGMHVHTFSKIRRIIALADSSDLRPEYQEAVAEALRSVNEGGGVKPAFESVRHIADAAFGGAPGQAPEKALALRVSNVANAVLGIVASCDALEYVDVPAGIPADKRDEWLQDLEGAVNALRNFRNRIKEA